MKLKLHTLLAYIAFDELITQSEVWARNLQRQVLGYSSEAISRRIIQRAVEIGCYPFTGYFFKNAELSNGKVVSDTHSFSGLTIFERSGRLSLSLRLRLTLVYGFIKYYVYIYYRVTRNFICGRKFKEGSATLLFGAESFADGVEERFSEYLSEGPISFPPYRSIIIHVQIICTKFVKCFYLFFVRIPRLPPVAMFFSNLVIVK